MSFIPFVLELTRKLLIFANMIRIDRHIEVLLLENDCVIVPGLGGFVAHEVEARYDADDALFLPPGRTIGFNPALKLNDSLLAQSIADTYDMGYPEAVRVMDKEVENILTTIEEKGTYELFDLGELSKNGDGKLVFEPIDGGILAPEYYGFGSYEMNRNLREMGNRNQAHPEERVAKPKFIYVETVEGTNDRRLSISMKALRDASLAVVVLTFVFIAGFTSQQKRAGNVQEPLKSGVLYNVIDESKPQISPTPMIKAKTRKTEQAKTDQAKHHWAIVLASHVTEKNALSFVEKLHKDGYTHSYVHHGRQSIKVLYGSFHSAQAAREELNSLRSKAAFSQSWILEVKE